MMQNFWENDPVVDSAPPTPTSIVVGEPDPAYLAEQERAARAEQRAEGAAARAQAADARAAESHRVQMERTGAGGARPLQQGEANTLRETANVLRELEASLQSFQNDYSGNLFGGTENTLQGLNSDIGTPGQRDWWARFRRSDISERNALFGATLTPSENAAFAATTVTPRMDPEEVRSNIARRAEMARTALRRQREFLVANGYRPEAIDALIGPELLSTPAGPQASGMPNGSGYGGQDAEGNLIVDVVGGQPNPDTITATPPRGPNLGRAIGLGVGDLVQGAGDILGVVGNPFAAGVNGLLGTDFSTDMGATMRGGLGLPTPQNDQERFASALNRGGMAGFTAAGMARAAAPAVAGAAGSALSRFGAAPLTDAFAGAASGGGGEGARQAGAGPVGQIISALVAGGLSLPVATRMAARMNPQAPIETALTRAGAAEEVDVNRAMVDPNTMHRVTGTEASLAGGPIMRRNMGRVGEQIEGRVRRLGRGGEVLEDDVAGETVRGASQRFIKNSGQQARRLYDAAETASEGVRVQPQRSLEIIDEMTARLSETGNTNSAELAFLNGLKEDLASNLSVGALRDLRTTLRKRITDGGLTFGQNEARVLDIMEAAGQDIEAGLRGAGRDNAAQLFRRADDMYRDRMDFIQNTLQRTIGTRNRPLPAGQVMQNLRTLASPRGNNAGFARLLQEMEPEEQADIAATFAEALGRNPKGEFSTAYLVRQARKVPRNVQRTLFGERGVQSLDNLRTLAREHDRVSANFNWSKTGRANDWQSYILNAVLGGGAGLITESGTTAAGAIAGLAGVKAGRDILSARTLMSPNVQRWLREAPQGNSPRAIARHIDRLSAVAVREPAIAAEIHQLQQMLGRVANDNLGGAMPSAASPAGEDEGNR